MIIAEMKWTLLTAVVSGKDKMISGKVKSSTHSTQIAKYYDKITWGYWPRKKACNCLITDEFSIALLSTQINIFLLSILTSAAKVMPNLQTKLR